MLILVRRDTSPADGLPASIPHPADHLHSLLQTARFERFLDEAVDSSEDQFEGDDIHLRTASPPSSSAKSPVLDEPHSLEGPTSETATHVTTDLFLQSPEPEDEWTHEPEETFGTGFRQHPRMSQSGRGGFQTTAAGSLINLRELRRMLQMDRDSVSTKENRLLQTIRNVFAGLRSWPRGCSISHRGSQRGVRAYFATSGTGRRTDDPRPFKNMKERFINLSAHWDALSTRQQKVLHDILNDLDDQQRTD